DVVRKFESGVHSQVSSLPSEQRRLKVVVNRTSALRAEVRGGANAGV
ncbi:hypothetical protein AVEN_63892-1, partial [Araneus ventricosus]